MCDTLCSESQHISITWYLFGITEDRYSKSSINIMSWYTIRHISLPLALASAVLILSLKWKAYNCLTRSYPGGLTQLWLRGARSTWIKILSNRLPCPHHISTHLAIWTITVSGSLSSCIVTVTPFTWYIYRRSIHDWRNPEYCRSSLVLIYTWNLKKWDVRTSINSDVLISSGNFRVTSKLHFCITPLIQYLKLGDSLSDGRESPAGSFLWLSACGRRVADLMIRSNMRMFNVISTRRVSHRNICRI